MSGLADGPVVVVGAGAVGAYVGGMLALSGDRPVVLLDPWAEHVAAMRAGGLRVEAPEGALHAQPHAFGLDVPWAEAARVVGGLPPPALGLVCAKLHDTEAATQALVARLPPDAPVVTMQNGLVEDLVARIPGRRARWAPSPARSTSRCSPPASSGARAAGARGRSPCSRWASWTAAARRARRPSPRCSTAPWTARR